MKVKLKVPASNASDLFKTKFRRELAKSNSAPFLFAGSGLSIRYYGIPTWIELLKTFVSNHKNCFKYEFGYYSSSCLQNPLEIAEILAHEFHEYWWKEDEFKSNRLKYQSISAKNKEIPFKIELCELIFQLKEVQKEFIVELELFKLSNFSGILTTNWDDQLQVIFKDFNVKIGQKQVIFSEQHHIGEIYKIHGCISNPDSLVVTKTDYDNFIRNNHYLNSKILTLFADFPVVFMGYSLSDPNIELILKNIVDCLQNDLISVEKLKNRLFFVEWQSDPCNTSIETTTHVLKSVSLPINKIKAHSYTEVYEVLGSIPRKLPIQVLRQLQEMVYDFVITTEPTKKVMVNGLESLNSIENLEVVVGFGNISKLQEKGVMGIQDLEIFEDILFDTIAEENYKNIAEQLLPKKVKKNLYLPFFKYNRRIDNLNPDNSLIENVSGNFVLERSNKITLIDYRAASQISTYSKQNAKYMSFQELLDDNDLIHAIMKIQYFDLKKLDAPILRQFLRENWTQIDSKSSYFSHFRKCICILDYLENTYQKE